MKYSMLFHENMFNGTIPFFSYKEKDAPTFEKIIQVQCDRKYGWLARYQKNAVVQVYTVQKVSRRIVSTILIIYVVIKKSVKNANFLDRHRYLQP